MPEVYEISGFKFTENGFVESSLVFWGDNLDLMRSHRTHGDLLLEAPEGRIDYIGLDGEQLFGENEYSKKDYFVSGTYNIEWINYDLSSTAICMFIDMDFYFFTIDGDPMDEVLSIGASDDLNGLAFSLTTDTALRGWSIRIFITKYHSHRILCKH